MGRTGRAKQEATITGLGRYFPPTPLAPHAAEQSTQPYHEGKKLNFGPSRSWFSSGGAKGHYPYGEISGDSVDAEAIQGDRSATFTAGFTVCGAKLCSTARLWGYISRHCLSSRHMKRPTFDHNPFTTFTTLFRTATTTATQAAPPISHTARFTAARAASVPYYSVSFS
jgi:hypothetical protein